ncbi:zinc ABC transporter substrate-binding protein [Alphaproteobacteria bacterium]|nr:zinc ABC transporter substrate-binding protein [Alphaproteobacteria bacterium]
MRNTKITLIATAIFSSSVAYASEGLNVVTSIKPIHSLVSAVMDGIGTPSLIVEGAGSPHTYALKPSQAKALQDADLVFWVGPAIESFLEKPIKEVASSAHTITLSDAPGLIKIEFREGGNFDSHDEHAKHDDHGQFDMHMWLDPKNAKTIVNAIEAALIKADPLNIQAYKGNAVSVKRHLDKLITEVDAELGPVKGKPYVVFHDAYQYFENRFGMTSVGSITVSPEVLPGAKRVKVLREKIKSLNATCVFSEPQFEPKLIATVIENTSAGAGVLDPLGASINVGPEMYFTLIRNMSKSLKECLQRGN